MKSNHPPDDPNAIAIMLSCVEQTRPLGDSVLNHRRRNSKTANEFRLCFRLQVKKRFLLTRPVLFATKCFEYPRRSDRIRRKICIFTTTKKRIIQNMHKQKRCNKLLSLQSRFAHVKQRRKHILHQCLRVNAIQISLVRCNVSLQIQQKRLHSGMHSFECSGRMQLVQISDGLEVDPAKGRFLRIMKRV